MKLLVLYPAGFTTNEIDPDYLFECEIAKTADIQTIFFNYDAYIMGERLKLFGNLVNAADYVAIYRGWMMKPEKYRQFYNDLSDKGISLINSPEEYCNCHMFPYSYNKLQNLTPKTLIFPENEEIDWDSVRCTFDRFMIKDFVKSVKGFGFPEYLTSEMSNAELDQYVLKFKNLRDELFTGGIVLKQYVELDRIGGHTHEFRAFYVKGQLATIYQNSDNKEDDVPEDVLNNKELCLLNSNFYTIDFARTTNGKYIVIETGDGQVSGLPSETEAELLYTELKHLFWG